MAATLDDAWAKVEWAHGHLERLHAVMKRYRDEGPDLLPEKLNPEGTHRVLTAQARPVPPEVPFLLGDLVHALHSALDYVVCSLVESNGKPVSVNHAWPIFSDPILYQRKAPQMLRYVPYRAISLIESLQPYNEPWGYELGRLYDLSIEEKHRALLVTTSFPFPKYVGHSRPAEQSSGIGFRMSSTCEEAYIDLPVDPLDPDEKFDPHFTVEVTLVKEGPLGRPVDDIGRGLYREVAHHVLAKVRWLNLIPLRHPRELPFAW